jgi:hypothetical protein
MNKDHHHRRKYEIARLKPIVKDLLKAKTVFEKISALSHLPQVSHFIAHHEQLRDVLTHTVPEGELAIKAILAINEGHVVFHGLDEATVKDEEFTNLLNQLLDIEKFYDNLGGIVGYHLAVLELIEEEHIPRGEQSHIRYLKPVGTNLTQDTLEIRQHIIDGITNLDKIAVIFPVGGAGDRLNLKDEKTEEALPAAKLLFNGKSLLETNFIDIQALEYLYCKLFDKNIHIPIVMMTSHEKNNHSHIVQICEQNRWFSRPINTYFLFHQPLAPVITKTGRWSLSDKFNLTLKPGGHGVIWKLAHDKGVFNWLKTFHCHKALVRQINNPVAGTDQGILGLIGIGFMKNKTFGFASCPRLINTAEGMDVLIEEKTKKDYAYCISNVEYTEFTKKGIHDQPESPSSRYSAFPANTNLLFVDLETITNSVKKHPLPGRVLNMKTKTTFMDEKGDKSEIEAGRLESTMQNVADTLQDHFDHPILPEEQHLLKTYLTENKRSKTISVTKKAYTPGKPIDETPEGCFYDILANNYELLTEMCGMKLPPLPSPEEYIQNGPSFIALFHPALGPLWSIIAQKIQGGFLSEKSELQIDIAEFHAVNLQVEGSLIIRANSIMGEKNSQEILKYGIQSGKCELINVKVVNKGINWEKSKPYWKNQFSRQGSLKIIIKGTGEFYAEDVTFQRDLLIEVPDGIRMVAYEDKGNLQILSERISKPTWYWKYEIDKDAKIVLSKSG